MQILSYSSLPADLKLLIQRYEMNRPKLRDDEVQDLRYKIEGNFRYGMKYKKRLLNELDPTVLINRIPAVGFTGDIEKVERSQINNGACSTVPLFLRVIVKYKGWADDFLQALVNVDKAELANFLHPDYASEPQAAAPPKPDYNDSPSPCSQINPGIDDQITEERKCSSHSRSAKNKFITPLALQPFFPLVPQAAAPLEPYYNDSPPPYYQSIPGMEDQITEERKYSSHSSSATNEVITPSVLHPFANTLDQGQLQPQQNNVSVVKGDSNPSQSAEYSSVDNLDKRIQHELPPQPNRFKVEVGTVANPLSESQFIFDKPSKDTTTEGKSFPQWDDTGISFHTASILQEDSRVESNFSTQEESRVASITESDLKFSDSYPSLASTSSESSESLNAQSESENKLKIKSINKTSENIEMDIDGSDKAEDKKLNKTETKINEDKLKENNDLKTLNTRPNDSLTDVDISDINKTIKNDQNSGSSSQLELSSNIPNKEDVSWWQKPFKYIDKVLSSNVT